MSAEATGYVWNFSPYRGAQLLVHLAIADVVNDVHDNEFWMSIGALARKARVDRTTVERTFAHMVEKGHLELIESGAARRKPSRYRFRATCTTPVAGGTTGAAPVATCTTPVALPASARTNSSNNSNNSIGGSTNSPQNDCVRCHGSGTVYNASGGFDVPCSCATVVE